MSYLVGNVVDVLSALDRADAVHKRHLVEVAVTHAEADLPAVALLLVPASC